MSVDEQQARGIWRPLVVSGVPLHRVLPIGSAVLGVGLLLTGGGAAIAGGWILTVAFPLAVGAFVADARALAAPAALWVLWLVVVAASGDGSGLAQTPIGLAVLLAALGAVGVWLGQRAVQPAVEHPHGSERTRGVPGIDELLAPFADPADSPSLDPSAEVDGAIAELLDEELSPDLVDQLGQDDDAQAAAAGAAVATEPSATDTTNPQAHVEAEDPGESDPTGHVIEFAALREDDLIDDQPPSDLAPLPAATEAGRRDPD